jgi:hypothetical protein
MGVLAPEVTFQPTFSPRFRLPELRGPRDAVYGEKVFKVGAGSGLTRGIVKETAMEVLVGKNRIFLDVLRIEAVAGNRFMAHGDSGAIIVGEDGAPLGLFFAGADDWSYALACSITVSCSLLGYRVLVRN